MNEIIGICETSPNVWRVTIDGRILGDSRGYDKFNAIQEAQKMCGPNGRWEGSEWVEFVRILDPSLS